MAYSLFFLSNNLTLSILINIVITLTIRIEIRTPSGSGVKYDKENKPGISNLLTIYAALKEISIEEAEALFKDYRYGDFKKAVADAVVEEIEPFQARYHHFLDSKEYIEVLRQGREKAKAVASKTLARVKHAVGLLDIDEE